MSLIDGVGVSLSAAATFTFGWLLIDVFRGSGEEPFGKRRATTWFWAAILSASFLGGLYGLRVTGSSPDAESASPFARPADTRWSALRLPFYIITKQEERARGDTWHVVERQGEFQLPWAFMGGVVLYLLLRPGRPSRIFTAGGQREPTTGCL